MTGSPSNLTGFFCVRRTQTTQQRTLFALYETLAAPLCDSLTSTKLPCTGQLPVTLYIKVLITYTDQELTARSIVVQKRKFSTLNLQCIVSIACFIILCCWIIHIMGPAIVRLVLVWINIFKYLCFALVKKLNCV